MSKNWMYLAVIGLGMSSLSFAEDAKLQTQTNKGAPQSAMTAPGEKKPAVNAEAHAGRVVRKKHIKK